MPLFQMAAKPESNGPQSVELSMPNTQPTMPPSDASLVEIDDPSFSFPDSDSDAEAVSQLAHPSFPLGHLSTHMLGVC